jgi:hypothetical protein
MTEKDMEVTGVIDLIGRPRVFGQNKRVNIKLRDAPIEWISLVSKPETVKEFTDAFRQGDKIRAICRAHNGRDVNGTPRMELWVQRITKLQAVKEVSTDTLAVDKHYIEAANRAVRIYRQVKKGGLSEEETRGLLAAIFDKLARPEFYLKEAEK